MTEFNAAIFAAAGDHLGLEQWPGAAHNPTIVAMFADKGHSWVQDDETPWCAAFVGSVLAQLGLPHTGKLNARSYLDWGEGVDLQDAQPGDVVVLWRISPSAWQGHVGFFAGIDGDRVILRGGNQGNRVSDARYPISRVLGVRRAVATDAESNRPSLAQGARGMFVRDLQEQLTGLGYALGRVDGAFGPLTRDAVLEFQADNDLPTTGKVDARFWQALIDAPERPSRDVDIEDLRKSGSRTIGDADKGQAGTLVGVGSGAAILGLDRAEEALATIEQAEGLLSRGMGLVQAFWPVLLLVAVGGVLWWLFSDIKRARLDDAVRGRNLGR